MTRNPESRIRGPCARSSCLILWAPWAVSTMTPATAQSGARAGEWRSYGADLANTRYSPLDQINAGNFKNLEVAWRFKTDNLGPRPEFNLQSTPLVVNGILYTTAGTRRAVVALDAATGEMKWVFSLDEGKRGEAAPRRLSGRGLSYWTDGKEERIIYVTPGYQMIALNAATGRPVPAFGKDGMVDLKLEDDQLMDLVTGEIGLHAAPIVVNDVVVIGAAHLPGGVPKSRRNEKGYVRGYDARTGKRLWIFHTIPQPGEFGNDTWLKDSWAYTGNTGNWGQMSGDEELGLRLSRDRDADGRLLRRAPPGNNLFSDSIVALDVKTGKRIWYFQTIHHDIWDWDLPAAPDPRHHHRQRTTNQGARAAEQAGFSLRLRSDERPARVAHRGTAGGERRRAGRVVLADATVPDEAAGVRTPGRGVLTT